jgi:peptide/nickel transport system substrate-binding protein
MRVITAFIVSLIIIVAAGSADAGPEGQITWAEHTTVVPSWLDPGESLILTGSLYALHDALVKPMPGNDMAPSLAESWTTSSDGLVYDFILREGVTFHDGEPVTAEDVKFSFERYRANFAKTVRDKVAAVDVLDSRRIRFRLKQPWPDFMVFYGTLTTRASWIVPKKYIEKVGDDGFKKSPIGAGPYRFVSFTPGVELVLEAFEGYWRKTPTVKRLVFRVIPEPTTRLAALKRAEVDVAYFISGELADDLLRMPGLTLKATYPATHWLYFADQWDPKSPWHDQRVRLAASYAIDREAMNHAITSGLSRIRWSVVKSTFDFYWQSPGHRYDPSRAKQLLTEAGYSNGFDAGELFCDLQASATAEAVADYLNAVGIRTKLRPLERAAFFGGLAEKKLRNLIYVFTGDFGNAATRLEGTVVSGGIWTYGSYPDLDALFQKQAAELDRAKREAVLHQMQQLVFERVIAAPIWEIAFTSGVGSRVEEAGLGLISNWAFSGPYEDVKLKGK